MRFEGNSIDGHTPVWLLSTTYEVARIFVAFLVLHTKYTIIELYENILYLFFSIYLSVTYKVYKGI